MNVVLKIRCEDIDDLMACLKRLKELKNHLGEQTATRVEHPLVFPIIVLEVTVWKLPELRYLLEMALTEFGDHTMWLTVVGEGWFEYTPEEEES